MAVYILLIYRDMFRSCDNQEHNIYYKLRGSRLPSYITIYVYMYTLSLFDLNNNNAYHLYALLILSLLSYTRDNLLYCRYTLCAVGSCAVYTVHKVLFLLLYVYYV